MIFLEVAMASKNSARAFFAKSMALCALWFLASIAALGNTASFQVAMTGTVAAPSIPNVYYSSTGAPISSTFSFITVSGDGSINYTTIIPEVLFSGGVMSFTEPPVSGSASAGMSSFAEFYSVPFQIDNANEYAVSIPITISTDISIDLTCVSCNLSESSIAGAGIYLENGSVNPLLVSQIECDYPDILFSSGGCFGLPGAPRTPATFPVDSVLSETVNLSIAANTDASFTVMSLDDGSVSPTVPEPESMILFCTGLVGFIGVIRRANRQT